MSFVRLPATVLNDRFLLENELYLVYWIEIWIFFKVLFKQVSAGLFDVNKAKLFPLYI